MAYITQVLHDVEEVVGLLAPVAHSIDGFAENQIFGDLCPHVLLLGFDGSLSLNVSDVLIIGADEFGPADAVISLPDDFLGAATDSVQLNALSAGWNVDDGPICSGTVPSLAGVGALQSFAIIVIGFNLKLGIDRGRCSITTSGRAERGRVGSHLKVMIATSAAINLNIKLLKLGRTSTFPGSSHVSVDCQQYLVDTYSLRLISISMRSLRGGDGGAGGGGGGVGERALSTPALSLT